MERTPHHPRERAGVDGRVLAGLVLVGLGALLILAELLDAVISPQVLLAVGLVLLGAWVLRPHRAEDGSWAGWAREMWGDGWQQGQRAVRSAVSSRGIGDLQLAPATVDGIPELVEHAIGDVQIDLTRCAVPSARTERAVRMKVGDLRVIAPAAFPLEVRARVNVGDVELGDAEHSGRNLDVRVPPEAGDAAALVLDLQLTTGDIVVERT